MENIDLIETKKINSQFLSKHFYRQRFSTFYSIGFKRIGVNLESVDELKKSIEIIKSGEYSKQYFKEPEYGGILYGLPPIQFLEDNYWLKYYEEKKIIAKELIQTTLTEFDNNPYKEEDVVKYDFDREIEKLMQGLNDLDELIKLTKEFRDLINDAMPELEKVEFPRILKEHNDLQESEAARIQERYEERKKRIEEKRKQIEENIKIQEQQPRTIKENEIRRLFINELNLKQRSIVQTKGDRLISSLRIDRTSKKEYSRIAKMMYSSKKITTDRDFKDWLPKFYDLIGIENGTIYKPVDLEPDGNLKQEFDYL